MEPLKRLVNYYRNDMRLMSKLLLSHLAVVLVCSLTVIVFFGSSVYNLLIETTIHTKQQTASTTAATVSDRLQNIMKRSESVSDCYLRYISQHYLAEPEQDTRRNLEALAQALQETPASGIRHRIYLTGDMQWILQETTLAKYVQDVQSVYGTYWYGIMSSVSDKSMFCPSLYLSPQEIDQYGELAYIRRLPNLLGNKQDGYIVTYFSENPVLEALTLNLGDTQGAFYIINSRDALVCDSNSEMVGAYYINSDEVDHIIADGGTATYLGQDIIVCSYFIDWADWRVVSILLEADALKEADRAVWQFVTIYALVSILGSVLAIVLARSVSGRIAFVASQIRKTPKVRPTRIKGLPHSEDEIGQLVDSYNGMIDSLNGLMDWEAEAATTLRLSEFKALQAQINPHFLYNSLDMINWLTLAGEPERVCEAVRALGKFYKLTLSKKDTFGTVQKETEHASLYIKLQNMRFENRIRLVMDIDENIHHCVMPKLVFQPLVENAIIHGIMEREDKAGEIIMAGWREQEDLVFLICDNGVGMTQARLDQIMQPNDTRGNHIGVYNTNERLKLYYGPEYGLTYKSTLGVGTEVQVRIPFTVKENDGFPM